MAESIIKLSTCYIYDMLYPLKQVIGNICSFKIIHIDDRHHGKSKAKYVNIPKKLGLPIDTTIITSEVPSSLNIYILHRFMSPFRRTMFTAEQAVTSSSG